LRTLYVVVFFPPQELIWTLSVFLMAEELESTKIHGLWWHLIYTDFQKDWFHVCHIDVGDSVQGHVCWTHALSSRFLEKELSFFKQLKALLTWVYSFCTRSVRNKLVQAHLIPLPFLLFHIDNRMMLIIQSVTLSFIAWRLKCWLQSWIW